jgi:uncharacterized protein
MANLEVDAMAQPQIELAPVAPQNRIATLDVLRGFAVLGILAVNAAAFAYPSAVYFNPALGPFPLSGDAAVAEWVVTVFFHSKFIALFTMLFGASIFLVGGERKDRPRGRLIRNRLFWLIVIALIHGLLFWYGDVLLMYGVAGLLVMLVRSWKARTLILVGAGITTLMFLLQGGSMLALMFAPPEVVANVASQMGGAGGASAADVSASIAAYRSGWSGMLAENFKSWSFLQAISVTGFLIPTAGLMMLGMGLLKSGFWAGRAPAWVYGLLIVVGGAVLGALGWTEWQRIGDDEPLSRMDMLATAAGAAPVLITLAYASLLILLTTRGAAWLTAAFAPVGRMAFTNSLSQTVIMTTLFTQPWGPQWIGTMDRPALWGVVGAVWLLQLIWSPLWLSMFRMGPLEWVWRCLSYGRLLPIRNPRT